MSDKPFDLVAHTKTAARDAVNGLENPEDDILPVVLTYGPRGLQIMGAPMPQSEEDKNHLADVITARMAVNQATEATMVCPAYASSVNAATGEIEERQEIVMLLHSAAGVQEAWFAPVTRHEGRPPDMSVWEDVGEGCMMGRFATALEAGLFFAQTSYADPELAQIIEDGHREGRIEEMTKMFLAAKDLLEGSPDVSNGSA